MTVEAVEDEAMIAGTIVEAAEAMELSTSTPKVRLVGRMSSRICRCGVTTSEADDDGSYS